MSLTVSQSESSFELVPEGQYVARCYRIIDLGTQEITYLNETKLQKKILITWEILDDETKTDDGTPYSISKQYTASLDEKSNLYKDLTSWRGKKFTAEELEGFSLENILDKYCTIQVVHSENNGKTYANINALMGYKGTEPDGVNEPVMFDMDQPDMKLFDSFSDGLKDWIRKSKDWKGNEASQEVVIDDIDEEPVDLSDIPI